MRMQVLNGMTHARSSMTARIAILLFSLIGSLTFATIAALTIDRADFGHAGLASCAVAVLFAVLPIVTTVTE